MATVGSKLSQKDYLKKYLSGGDGKKKKKKKPKGPEWASRATVKVIDDDVDISKLQPLDESALDLYELNEDAPQIAGIVDERPAELQALDQYKQTQRWKVLNNSDGDGISVSVSGTSKQAISVSSGDAEEEFSVRPKAQDGGPGKQSRDGDSSPPRRKRKDDVDESPPRRRRQSDSDASPPRKARGDDSDESPPRNKRQVKHHSESTRILNEKSHKSSSRKRNEGSDTSPPRRRQNKESGRSPHRKGKNYDSDETLSRKKRQDDSDTTPPRRKRQDDSDTSPPRKQRQEDSDTSPPRRKQHNESDASPPRKRRPDDSRRSPPRKKPTQRERRYDSDTSPPRRRTDKEDSINPNLSKQKLKPEDNDHGRSESKMKKTLDGKAAGLQNAKNLKQELQEFKQREESVFAKMDDTLSGRGAAVVRRDRKTGLKRDLEREQAEQRIKDEKDNKSKEKYTRWGKGLKQTEDQQNRLQTDLYEMSKPLARYADDADLDTYYRDQDREGDPMLEYLRTKKKDEAKARVPIFQGSFPPNRYNIRPGYRWDGVDRSGGYEKKWFEAKNAKKAVEEEAYKWSTSDM